MEAKRLYRFYTESQENEFLFSFKQAITHERLEQTVALIRQSLGSSKPVKRVFAVFVELAQNILSHSAEKAVSTKNRKTYGIGILEIAETPDCYQVISGNLIERDTVTLMRDRIDSLKNYSSAELKKIVMEQRRQPMQNNHAGLGLMMIARKSNGQLNLHTQSHDRDFDFMVISAQIAKESDTSNG